MRRSVVLAAVLAGCRPAAPEMPWLFGLDNAISSTGLTSQRSPPEPAGEDCGAGAAREIEIVADVAPARGNENIVATYAGGIAVFDREGGLIAKTPGYSCEGSQDELEVVAVGTAHGRRVLAIAATSGGRRETVTWLSLFHTGATLEPVFTAIVEQRADLRVERGWVYLLPGALLYERPGGTPRLWTLDPGSSIYIPPYGDLPHDEPPLVQREMTSESNSTPSASIAWSTSSSTPTSR